MILRISFFLIFFLFIKSSYALNLPKEVLQGSLIVGQEPSIDQIMVDNVKTKLSEEGYYVFPVGRDHINPIQVMTFLNNKIIQIHEINIIKQEYEIGRKILVLGDRREYLNTTEKWIKENISIYKTLDSMKVVVITIINQKEILL